MHAVPLITPATATAAATPAGVAPATTAPASAQPAALALVPAPLPEAALPEAPAADVADQGNDLYEYEFNLSLLQNQEQTLAEIRDALDRMDNGTYGKCEECSEMIAKPRLQALPYTKHCIKCAREMESRG